MAIISNHALLPHEATGTTVAAAAVHVGFDAVLLMVRALIGNADVQISVAGVAQAIAIVRATDPDAALRTSAAAAVDAGFGAVFSVVCALNSIATEKYAVAGVARAIAVDLAI